LLTTIVGDVELVLNTNVGNLLTGGLADAPLSVNGGPGQNAQVAGYNSLRWAGVRIGPGSATLEISNVRADASLVGVSAGLTPNQLVGFLTLTSAAGVPITNSSLSLAFVQNGLAFQRGTASPSTGGAESTVPLVFREGFAGAFQSGGAGATRLRAVLRNIPAGTRIFAPLGPAEGVGRARLLTADAAGNGGAAAVGVARAGGTYAEVSVAAGVAAMTWETLLSDPLRLETWTLPLIVENATEAQLGVMLADTTGTFAPVSALSGARAGAPVPRYRDVSVAQRRVGLRLRSVIAGQAAATVGKAATRSRALFGVGERVSLTQTVSSEGTEAPTNVTIRNNLPTGLLFQSCSVPCTESGGQVIIPAPPLDQPIVVNTQIGPALSQGGVVSNWSTVDSDEPTADLTTTAARNSIEVASAPPAVTLAVPVSGTGTTKTFVVTFIHAAGFEQFGVINMLINRALDGGNACYIAYSHPAKVLFLVNDGGPDAGLSAALPLGSTGQVSNGQCTVSSAGSSAVGSGNTLTLSLNIAFTTSFGGNKVVYLAARDSNGGNSGWSTSGFHEVPTAVTFPNPGSMTPGAGTGPGGGIAFTYDDQTSTNNLRTVWGLVNTALDARGSCYFAYFVPGNILFLFPDNGDGGAVTNTVLSGAGMVENSQCRITAAGSTVTKAGGRLTVTLNVTFKPGFAGGKAVWLALQTLASVTSPWKVAGAWQVP